MKKSANFYLIFAIQFLGLFAMNCYAENIGASSLEWLTVSSEVIATGKVLSVETVKGKGEVVYENYVIKVSENIKVEKREKLIKFTIRAFATHPVFGKTINISDEVIVFLTLSDENEELLKNKFVPTTGSFPLSVFNLKNHEKQINRLNLILMDMNFEILTYKSQIIKTCRQSLQQLQVYLKNHKWADVKGFWIDRPSGSKNFYPMGFTDLSYLRVPNFMAPESKATIFELFKSS